MPKPNIFFKELGVNAADVKEYTRESYLKLYSTCMNPFDGEKYDTEKAYKLLADTVGKYLPNKFLEVNSEQVDLDAAEKLDDYTEEVAFFNYEKEGFLEQVSIRKAEEEYLIVEFGDVGSMPYFLTSYIIKVGE